MNNAQRLRVWCARSGKVLAICASATFAFWVCATISAPETKQLTIYPSLARASIYAPGVADDSNRERYENDILRCLDNTISDDGVYGKTCKVKTTDEEKSAVVNEKTACVAVVGGLITTVPCVIAIWFLLLCMLQQVSGAIRRGE